MINQALQTPELTVRQKLAIALAARVGDDIKRRHPEVADHYRGGLTAPRIVVRYDFPGRYGISLRIATTAVRNAIGGYHGLFYPPYEGLIADSSERQRLARQHESQSGLDAYVLKRGVHALTRDQIVACGGMGGAVGGPLTHRLGIGCHGLPPEVLRDHCRRIAPLGGKAGGLASVVSRGLVPFLPASPDRPSELEFIVRLASDPAHRGPIRTDYVKLAAAVNERFHAGRERYTHVTIKTALSTLRRRGQSPDRSLAPDLAFALDLSGDDVYQLPARVNVVEIARRVNEEYHQGRPVRSGPAVKNALQRHRKACSA